MFSRQKVVFKCNLIYNLQRSGKICTAFYKYMFFFPKTKSAFLLLFVCCKIPTDAAENIRVMFAFSTVTGHNSNLEIRIRNKIMHVKTALNEKQL